MGKAIKGHRWAFDADVKSTNPSEGVERKVLAYSDDAMCVVHHFKKGAIGQVHSHPHTQITYVAGGVFEFEIESEKKIVKTGDAMFKHSNVIHGAICLEEGTLIDLFTPMRQDFV